MEKFHKEVLVGKEFRIFQFTQLKNVNGTKFFVTSVDEKKKPISFSLKQTGADWKLIPGSLRWLYTIEPQLADAIHETRM